jgi:hypothetical protein
MKSVTEQAIEHGVDSFTVGPGEYADSGFTRLNMSSATYVAAKSFEERVTATLSILAAKKASLTYLYFPELDSIAHSQGVASSEWLNKLEDLDASLKKLASSLPKDAGLLVTADHGIVDVAQQNQIYLDEMDLPGLLAVTGDPRNTFLYFEPETPIDSVQNMLAERLDGRVFVATPEELKQKGWLKAEVANSAFLPDLYLISSGTYACYHRLFCKPQSLKMVGQHGSISQAELSVPLLKFGSLQN